MRHEANVHKKIIKIIRKQNDGCYFYQKILSLVLIALFNTLSRYIFPKILYSRIHSRDRTAHNTFNLETTLAPMTARV